MRLRPSRAAAFSALSALALLLPTATVAQNLTQDYVMRPKAGMASAFQAALREHSQWREANGDPWSWTLWEVVSGENVGEIHARSDGHSWADWDSYGNSEFGAAALAHFNATVAPTLESVASYISEYQPELSMPPGEGYEVNVAQVGVYPMKPTQLQAFNEALTRFRQALMDAGWESPWVVDIALTGPGPVMAVATLCPDFACLEEPEPTVAEILTEAYGEEEAMEIFQTIYGSFDRYDTFIAVRRPDLSLEGSGGM